MALTFKHIFKSNSEYKDYKGLNYLDSLAYAAQEFLYTDEACDEYFSYNMTNHISLRDFMTLVTHFICVSTSEYGKAEISRYISAIRSAYDFLPEKIEYTKDDRILVSEASYELILSILWIAYVYAKFRSELKNKEDEKWCNAETTLYTIMQKESCLKSEAFEKGYLMKNVTPAIRVFVIHWSKKHVNQTANQEAESSSKADTPKQNEDVDNLRQQLEAAQKKIAELEKENEDLKEQVKAYEEQQQEETNLAQIDFQNKVRLDLLLRLMKKDGADLEKHGNKTRAATIMNKITGIPLPACKNYCSDPMLNKESHHQEIEELNLSMKNLEMKTEL